ncbi:hypothetical protein ACO0LD_09155 [Undibacterium sp. Ji83W]|uniref:hypothetical protein n=1 Tax=Undibacterium sp. Ji83W TaxID=3413043 RepID=UPI003BF10AE9
MNLSEYKKLVDEHLTTASQNIGQFSNSQLIDDIRNCFSQAKSNEALALIRNLLHQLALQHLCDQQPLQPYQNIAQALRTALISYGTSTKEEVDWHSGVGAAVRYHLKVPPSLPDDQKLLADARAQIISKSVLGLRACGYKILLKSSGELYMPKSDAARLQEDIDALAKKIGGDALMATALANIEPTYSAKTDRFNLGRSGQQVRLDAVPQLPSAFLFQMGLKFFHCKQVPGVGHAEFSELIKLLSFAVGILDLESDSMFGLIFARPEDILETTRISLLYDATFCLTQAKPAHVKVFLDWLLTNEQFSSLTCEDGFISSQILSTTRHILQETLSGCVGIQIISAELLAKLTGLDIHLTKRLLTNVFAHPYGKVNEKLIFPLQDSKVDSAFRPLLTDAQGSFLRLPRNIAARATMNAAINWCQNAWPDSEGFHEALGLALEPFVRDQFKARGVKFQYGEYGSKSDKGECDLVIQTDSHIVFFELKGKVLTRQSRSGDVVKALEDLADSLARPQAQAMERHAFLKEHGAMVLESDEGSSIIELGSREVLKVSVTRGELLSLHDRPYLQHYLIAGCQLRFETLNPKEQRKLDPLHKWFDKFKDAAKRAGEYDLSARFPFSRCWSLSLFQVLLLLERTTSADTFVKELLRTAYTSTPTRDYYATYEYLLYLDTLKPSAKDVI